jgi:hypothetical protein
LAHVVPLYYFVLHGFVFRARDGVVYLLWPVSDIGLPYEHYGRVLTAVSISAVARA